MEGQGFWRLKEFLETEERARCEAGARRLGKEDRLERPSDAPARVSSRATITKNGFMRVSQYYSHFLVRAGDTV